MRFQLFDIMDDSLQFSSFVGEFEIDDQSRFSKERLVVIFVAEIVLFPHHLSFVYQDHYLKVKYYITIIKWLVYYEN